MPKFVKIFMVRKIGVVPPSTLPLSNFRAKRGRSDLKNFFMDRCPKDEPTGKNLVCQKALPISEKNWKNLLGGGCPWPSEG